MLKKATKRRIQPPQKTYAGKFLKEANKRLHNKSHVGIDIRNKVGGKIGKAGR